VLVVALLSVAIYVLAMRVRLLAERAREYVGDLTAEAAGLEDALVARYDDGRSAFAFALCAGGGLPCETSLPASRIHPASRPYFRASKARPAASL
jgi:hypothetical protein